ncbi:hypothetical protein HZB88_00125 [archaeon]|nr:hypothetical protein [archaeon]
MQAIDELKRVDHMIFVTLKYSRTIEVMKRIIQKMMQVIEMQADEYYEYALAKKIVTDAPTIPLLKLKNLERLMPKDSSIKDIVDFYCLLKKINASEYKAREEYRKNITLITKDIEVNVDTLQGFLKKTREYILYIRGLMGEEKEE